MKNFRLYGIIFLCCWLFTFSAIYAVNPQDTLRSNGEQEADTLEYELIIIDPEFEVWYAQVQEPPSFYSEKYLENWNTQLVRQWNTQIPGARRAACLQNTYIDYDPSLSYGLELNHKLFYYFRYIHERCRIFYNVPGRW